MGFLIFSICLAVVAKFICYMEENRIHFWSALPVSMAMAIVIVYVLGLFQKLTWGVYLFIGLSVVCLVFLLAKNSCLQGRQTLNSLYFVVYAYSFSFPTSTAAFLTAMNFHIGR